MISVTLEESADLARRAEPLRFGVPFPRGKLADKDGVHVVDRDGRVLLHQQRVLARWPDRSVKWLLLDACAEMAGGSETLLEVRPGSVAAADTPAPLACSQSRRAILVEANGITFTMSKSGTGILQASTREGSPLLDGEGVSVELLDAAGRRHSGSIESVVVEEQGLVRTTVRAEGRFPTAHRARPLKFRLRATFFAGKSAAEIEVTVTNTRAARHAANLWDLGDRGSCLFRELAVRLQVRGEPRSCQWYARPEGECLEQDIRPWCIYQDSSGGENWDSSNHVDARGERTVRFRGYRVFGDSRDDVRQEGLRAQPAVNVATDEGRAAVAVQWFWQNFPTSIRLQSDGLYVGLFPGESAAVHELQGGERKRQTLWLDVAADGDGLESMRRLQQPVRVRPDPAMCIDSHAVPYLTSMTHEACMHYVGTIVNGPRSFTDNRETIDEYGWRNFGELYADHEAVHSPEDRPLVSHYNNQYDFVFAAGTHFLRTGDQRWRQLMEEAARHMMDIDIYHTVEDRAAYNGGLFWHTDHYKDAATATHRTYSRANYPGTSYGGGPSNEHNYTSGLLLYFYITGDIEGREAVLQLADWVVAMDDGSRTPFSILSARPTGLASCTVSPDFHGPGRGAGNSINALLDAFAACGNRSYFTKAEELLCRCIHPEDDVPSLGLENPEYRWSYLVFLQVLGKYLAVKEELGEFDYFFHYARESLLHYAEWMLENEVPYKDVLHKVELPTETWPAQDIRKCHVMHLAARHCGDARESAFSGKAAYFYDRCIHDLLGFETAGLTRPRVIIAAWGHVHDYFCDPARSRGGYGPGRKHNYDFGQPQEFTGQRAFLSRALRYRCRLVAAEVLRLLRDAAERLKLRAGVLRRKEPR